MPVAYTNILILFVFALLGTAAAYIFANAAALYGRLSKLCSGPLTVLTKRLAALTAESAPADRAEKTAETPEADSAAVLPERREEENPKFALSASENPPEGAQIRPSLSEAKEAARGLSLSDNGAPSAPASTHSPSDGSGDGREKLKAALICIGSISFFILTAAFMLTLPLILNFWNDAVSKGSLLNIKLISLEIAVFTGAACAVPLFFGESSESEGKAD